MVTDEPAGKADQDWRKGRQPWSLRDVPDGRGRRVAAHVQGHPDAYCPASGAARTSVRGAGIQSTNTTAGVRHHEGKATSFMHHEAGTYRFRCPRHPSRLGLFAMDAQKPDNGARLSRDPGKIFSEV